MYSILTQNKWLLFYTMILCSLLWLCFIDNTLHCNIKAHEKYFFICGSSRQKDKNEWICFKKLLPLLKNWIITYDRMNSSQRSLYWCPKNKNKIFFLHFLLFVCLKLGKRRSGYIGNWLETGMKGCLRTTKCPLSYFT